MTAANDKKWHWPVHFREYGKIELLCPHSIGHGGIHGCDGCCQMRGFKAAMRRAKGGKKK